MASLQDSTLASLSPAIFYDRPVHRLSVEEYERMAELGFFGDHRVELLEGVIVEMTPVGAGHRYCVAKLAGLLRALLEQKGWHVVEQAPVTFVGSEPLPDIAVVQGDLDEFRQRIPGPLDIGLLVEVAESSLPCDRKAKSRLYAAAGISDYWIVNLIDRQIELFTDLTPNAQGVREYRRRAVVKDQVELILEGRRLGDIRLAQILP